MSRPPRSLSQQRAIVHSQTASLEIPCSKQPPHEGAETQAIVLLAVQGRALPMPVTGSHWSVMTSSRPKGTTGTQLTRQDPAIQSTMMVSKHRDVLSVYLHLGVFSGTQPPLQTSRHICSPHKPQVLGSHGHEPTPVVVWLLFLAITTIPPSHTASVQGTYCRCFLAIFAAAEWDREAMPMQVGRPSARRRWSKYCRRILLHIDLRIPHGIVIRHVTKHRRAIHSLHRHVRPTACRQAAMPP